MRIKIFTSTDALDLGRKLDEIVNEFCRRVIVDSIEMAVEDGEIYIMVRYVENECCDHCCYEDCHEAECEEECESCVCCEEPSDYYDPREQSGVMDGQISIEAYMADKD